MASVTTSSLSYIQALVYNGAMTNQELPSKKIKQRLAPVLELIHRQSVVQTVTQRQQQPRADLIESLLERQQNAALSRELERLDSADIAHLLLMLPSDKRPMVWFELSPRRAGQVLVELNEPVAEDLIEITDNPTLMGILETLDIDELTEIADVLSSTQLSEAKTLLAANERQWLESTMAYPDETVGDEMVKDSINLDINASVNDAIELLRAKPEFPPQTDKLFVINSQYQLCGIVPLIALMRNPGNSPIKDCMDTNVVSFSPLDSAEEAGQAFERYDLISAPVVDEKNRLVGRLTVETMMDYLRERSDEKALAKEGLKGDTDFFGPILEGARGRWPWLCINLMTAFLATRFISLFENTIEQLVALATLMPVVASVGGNSGNQTAALVIRSLAMNQLHRDNMAFIYRKELIISTMNGLLWGSALGCFAWALYQNWLLGLVMALAITLNLILAALIGISVPVILNHFKKDPAMGSSVVLTFATDSMGFFLFLGLATVILL